MLAGVERLLVELIRRNDEVFLGLTQPQIFAVAFMVVGATLVGWWSSRLGWTPGRARPSPTA